MGNSNIKIFVTHTPNRTSKMVENEIFQHVVAGAVYNKKPTTLQCDNEGENISEKNKSYCELTTQYWAWKNVEADYYGFCHYRRYFSFSDEKLKESDYGTIEYPYMTKKAIEELKLDEKSIRAKVEQYDCLVAKSINTRIMDGARSVRGHYEQAYELHIEDYDLMLDIINEKYPELSKYAKDYSKGNKFYACNMFIMKKELFKQFSSVMFGILEEFEKRADMEKYSREAFRVTGHLGERITGIYYQYLLAKGNVKCGELQIALFKDVEPETKIEPFATKNNVPIVLAANDNYIPMMSVCIESLLQQTSSENNYDLVIFHTDITKEHQKELQQQAEKYDNVRVQFYNVGSRVHDYKLQAKEHITTETFYRFLILDIMKDYEKVIYIDSDLIVKHDIADLWKVDLGTNLISGVNDPDFLGQINDEHKDTMDYVKKVLKLKDPYSYFQAGVLVLNVKELRKVTNVETLLKMADTGVYKYSDQDILNVVCEGRAHRMDMRWNLITDCDHFRYAHVIRYAPAAIMTEYEEARKDPYIVHYAGFLKPWHRPYEDFAHDFWKIARQTPFYEELMYRMMEGNAWHISYNMRRGFKMPRFHIKDKTYRMYDRICPKGSKQRAFVRKYIKRLFIR